MDTARVRPGDSRGAAGLAPAALQQAARRMFSTEIEEGSASLKQDEALKDLQGFQESSVLLRGPWQH